MSACCSVGSMTNISDKRETFKDTLMDMIRIPGFVLNSYYCGIQVALTHGECLNFRGLNRPFTGFSLHFPNLYGKLKKKDNL